MVVDEFIVIENEEEKSVDSAEDGIIDVINVENIDYHFAKENEVADGICENSVNEPIIDMNIQGNSLQGLPEGYTRTEYTRSTGSQYIDTGYVPNQDTKIYAKFKASYVGNNAIFGVRDGVTSNICSVYCGSSSWQIRFGAYSSSTYGTTDTNIHEVEMSKDGVYLDGELIYTPSSTAFTCFGSLYLFAIHGVSSDAKGESYIYEFKIWDKGNLVRDYIPCKNTSNAKLNGMFDLANSKVYSSVSGTLSAGAEVTFEPSPEQPLEIKSVGERTINLADISQGFYSQYTGISNELIGNTLKTICSVASRGGTIDFGTLPIGTYKISLKKFSAFAGEVETPLKVSVQVNEKGINVSVSESAKGTFTLTEPSNVKIYHAFNNSNDYYILEDLMLYAGEEEKDFEPYGKCKIPVKISSNNILDTSKWISGNHNSGFTDTTSNYIVSVGDDYVEANLSAWKAVASEMFDISLLGSIGFKVNQPCMVDDYANYYVMLQYYYADKSKYSNRVLVDSGEADVEWFFDNISIPSSAIKYFRLAICSRKNALNNIKIYNMYINKDEAKGYTPHIPTRTTNIYLKEPLRKINDVADILDYKNKKVIRNIGSVIYNATESWSKYDSGNGYMETNSIFPDGKPVLCNMLVYSDKLIKTLAIRKNYANIYVYGVQDYYPTQAEWHTFLAENNMEVIGQLITPTEEAIEVPEISTLDGTTTLEIQTSIDPSETKINYWKQI